MLYTGDGVAIGSGGQPITGVGFQPDLTWLKKRSGGTERSHALFDVIRGATEGLTPNMIDAEATQVEQLTSFDSDGFTVGNGTTVNTSGQTYVGWNWKANGSGSANTDGTNIDSTVSVNLAAGFSICTYNGTGNAGDSFGHGLSQKPEVVIIKRLGYAGNWVVGSDELSGGAWTYYLALNEATAQTVYDFFNSAAPTASVVSLSDAGAVNYDNSISGNGTYVAYCFHSVEGYSKFGAYTGNGNADGTFVYTGFRPAWYMIRRFDVAPATGWAIEDNKREKPFNPYVRDLFANAKYQEQPDYRTDLLSNGFKARATSTNFNTSGGSYLYMAFAETPFKTANAR